MKPVLVPACCAVAVSVVQIPSRPCPCQSSTMLCAASLPQASLAPGLSRVLRLFFPLIKSETSVSCATLERGEEPTGSAPSACRRKGLPVPIKHVCTLGSVLPTSMPWLAMACMAMLNGSSRFAVRRVAARSVLASIRHCIG